ncbi:MAG: SDR family oxidoreductase, partial [Clostridia bacterium]|nr:SDR family oxidoreductase [Clostridia bacterium]
MKALITGASSGLGWDMAHILSEKGYDIIAVARRQDRLEKLREELSTNVEIVVADLSDVNQCITLASRASEVDVFINNAGFGVFGTLCTTNLDDELKMLDTNIRAVHVLTKLVAKEFQKRNSGYILNVSSLASFFPGPLFGAYYASKSYVLRLSQSLDEELRQENSKVSISVLCPGPVQTEFGAVAKVNFGEGTEKMGNLIVLTSHAVAKYAIKKMFDGKQVIIPGTLMKIAAFMRHILPDKLLAKAVYAIQSKKCVAGGRLSEPVSK